MSHFKSDLAFCRRWFTKWNAICGDAISSNRMLILLELAECGTDGIDQGELAARVGTVKSSLSRSLRHMSDTVIVLDGVQAVGLVRSEINPANRSKRTVYLSDTGLALMRRLYE